MSRTAMFLIPAAVALLCQVAVLIASTGGQFAGERGDLVIAGFLGGVAGLYVLGWAIAGVCYLFSGKEMSRGARVYVVIVVTAILSFFGYFGIVSRV